MRQLTADTTHFRQLLNNSFNLDELETLCFDLNINHETIPGRTIEERCRELIEYCRRHNRLDDLFIECLRARPYIAWADIFANGSVPTTDTSDSLAQLSAEIENKQVTIYMERPLDMPAHSSVSAVWQQLFPPDGSHSLQNRDRMLARVTNFWIKGLLDNSLTNNLFINIQKELAAEAVYYPWQRVVQRTATQEKLLPADTKLIELFDAHEGELLILGEPGSGKTTAMLELARTLLERAQQEPSQPIPVVLNLSTWTEQQSNFADWLVAELNIRYDVPKRIGKSWVEENKLTLLLDGLDEVAVEQRLACVESLNRFRQEHGFTPLVVCSRTAEYEALPVQLNLQTAVLLKPLTPDQIDSYLQQLDDDLSNVRTIIQEHPTLQELAQSPLMLNIICIAYRDAEATEVKAAGTVDARHSQLFDIYIQKMLARRGEHEEYSAGQTLHWLTWLARSMAAKNQTTFLIERLQPDWLANAKQQAAYSWSMRLIIGLALAIVLAVSFVARNGSPTSGILYGLVAGLILLTIWERVPPITIPRLGNLKLGLVEGFTFGLLFWLTRIWSSLPLLRFHPEEFGISLSTNFLIPAIFAAAAAGLVSTTTIDLVEKLTWSLRSALRRGLPGGLLVGVIFGRFGLGLPSWLGGLLVGLATLGAFGLTWSSDLDKKVDIQPNQGIRRSWNNALLAGLTLGILFGLSTGLSFYLFRSVNSGLRTGLGYGLAGTLAGGLIFGGYTCLQHVVLRFILYREGAIPKDVVRFLNYATERIFLRRVGAGYVFVHRLLLEHLAGLVTEEKPDRIARQTQQRFAWLTSPGILLLIIVVLFGLALIGAQFQQRWASNRVQATATAIQPTVAALIANSAEPAQLMSNGELLHQDDGNVSLGEEQCCQRNFVAEATFFNPYAVWQTGPWDYGLIFRANESGQYRLTTAYNAFWQLDFVARQNGTLAFSEIAGGKVSNFDTTAGGSNKIRLVAEDELAYFYINDQYIATLDISFHQAEDGTLAVGTGFFNGYEVEGEVTRFADFAVRPLP